MTASDPLNTCHRPVEFPEFCARTYRTRKVLCPGKLRICNRAPTTVAKAFDVTESKRE